MQRLRILEYCGLRALWRCVDLSAAIAIVRLDMADMQMDTRGRGPGSVCANVAPLNRDI